jgi:hypothetical protein
MDYFVYLRYIRESSLSSKARIVALIIASYNPSFPTNRQIAEGTGLCERTVRNAKVELVAAGYLRQTRTFNAANHYHIAAPVAVEGGMALPPKYKLNTNINTKEIQTNKTSFNNSFNLIDTGDVIDFSSETIATGTALKELTPAEIDELLSW